MIFFTDENVPHRMARLLEAFDPKHEIRSHFDHFEQGCGDVEWIAAVAGWEPKPVILCGDGRILTRTSEARGLKAAGCHFVCLARGWVNLDWHTQAWKIIKVWPDVCAAVERARQPSIFELSPSKPKVEFRYPLSGHRVRGDPSAEG